MAKVFQNNNKGQSLIEIIIALAIVGIMIGAATTAIVFNLRKGVDVEITQTANFLRQELADNIKVLTEADWHNLYDLTKSTQYYMVSSTRVFAIGTETLNISGKNFTRYFIVENVNRDNGDIADSGINDPSTQKITITVTGEGNRSINAVYYLTRNRNLVFNQTDWSGGSGQISPIIETNNRFANSTNINYISSTGSIKIEGF